MSDFKIHKHNYTNTQIQFGSNLKIDLTYVIFFEKVMVRGPQRQKYEYYDKDKALRHYGTTALRPYGTEQMSR